jgi:hypothetical protein
MVSLDIGRGLEVVETLERAKVKVSVALLAFLSEYEDWRLVISSRPFDTRDPRHAYRLLNDSLTGSGFAPKYLPPILILRTSDPFIRELRRMFGKTKSVEGMRLGNQLFGDRFVEDAYVYRIS